MKLSPKVVTVVVLATIAAFVTESHGPLGGFWAPSPIVPDAVGIQIPLFMLLGVLEALAFGLGLAFLLFGYEAMKRAGTISPGLTRGAHLAISWLLMNWWAHDSLHIHNGMDLNGLLGIEYAFHVTLIVSGLILVRFFAASMRPAAA
ncbi:MAG: hypothetical protein ACREL2_00130 [Gemmatimonadales bacterium]